MSNPGFNPEQAYRSILQFYDFAEELVNTVEYDHVTDHESQLDFIEPLVLKIEDATDTIAEEFREFVKTGKTPSEDDKQRIEESLSHIYMVLNTCKEIAQLQSQTRGTDDHES